MTRKIDEKVLGTVAGGAVTITEATKESKPPAGFSPGPGSGSGGGPSQPGVVENAAGTAPASGPVDLAP